nr:early light-induced protein 2, chloroplastic-like [Tanacetum cinerariifolium]
MIGFVSALAVELTNGQDLFTQVSNDGLVPLFKGVRAESKSNGLMTSDAELWNGRFAMLGLVGLAFIEFVQERAMSKLNYRLKPIMENIKFLQMYIVEGFFFKDRDYAWAILTKDKLPAGVNVKLHDQKKRSEVGRDVMEKQFLMADKSVEGSKHVNVALGSNYATRTPNVVNVGLESFPIVSEAHGIHSPFSTNEENHQLCWKALNFRTLFTPTRNEVDVVVSVESIRVISERNTWVLENGPWFIRNNPLILIKWNPDMNLLKEDVGNVLVWVKLHGVPMTAFSEDDLSAIATKLGTPLMLNSYTFDMYLDVVKNIKKTIQDIRGVLNVESSSTSTTSIVEKINIIERLIIDEKGTLVDDEGKPLAKVDSSGDHNSEDVKTYENDDYDFDPYDDDMYESNDIPEKIQVICDNLDIKVQGRNNK